MNLPIGKAILKVRGARGITQQEMADRMPGTWNRADVGKVENRSPNITIRRLTRMADALQIEPWRLMRIAARIQRESK